MHMARALTQRARRSLDVDSRAPLHWAAYKGFADTLRLLLVAGADLARGDREACTPLHWAAIRGNGEAVTLLLRARARPRPRGPAWCCATVQQRQYPAEWALTAHG